MIQRTAPLLCAPELVRPQPDGKVFHLHPLDYVHGCQSTRRSQDTVARLTTQDTGRYLVHGRGLELGGTRLPEVMVGVARPEVVEI